MLLLGRVFFPDTSCPTCNWNAGLETVCAPTHRRYDVCTDGCMDGNSPTSHDTTRPGRERAREEASISRIRGPSPRVQRSALQWRGSVRLRTWRWESDRQSMRTWASDPWRIWHLRCSGSRFPVVVISMYAGVFLNSHHISHKSNHVSPRMLNKLLTHAETNTWTAAEAGSGLSPGCSKQAKPEVCRGGGDNDGHVWSLCRPDLFITSN